MQQTLIRAAADVPTPAVGTAISFFNLDTMLPSYMLHDRSVLSATSFSGGALTAALNEAKGANIASATTTDIGAATGNLVHVTGTTTITGLGTVQAGTRRVVVFDGALTLTHHATNLILPTGANIVTAAGDVAVFVSEGSGAWRCASYQRATGRALLAAPPTVVTLTDASTIAVDASLGDNFRVVLGGARTLGNPSNLTNGQVLNFRIKQDGTGSRTLAYASKYKFPSGTAPVLTTTAGATDFLSCQYDSTDDTLMCVLNKAFG